MKKLAVVYPWSIEHIDTRFADTTNNLVRPDGYKTKFFRGRGWCSARRHNHCLEQAMLWGADLICIIGADQTYHTEDMLERLIARHNQTGGAITALVPSRGFVGGQGVKPFQPVVWRFHRDANGNSIVPKTPKDVHVIQRSEGDFLRINGCGTGVLLFPASALKWLKPPWFTETPSGPSFERTSCTDWPFVNRLQHEADLSLHVDTTIIVKHLQMFEIDDTFQDRFADWAKEGGGDPNTCEYRSEARANGPIRQVRVSPSISFFDEKFRNRYGLDHYQFDDQPAFFFGVYTAADMKMIQQHQVTAVIIWAGSDAKAMREAVEATRKPPAFGPAVRHVAISKFIADDLDAVGLKYVRLPLCCVDESKFQPSSVADKNGVFAFVPEDDDEKYGGPLLREIQELVPDVEWVVQRDRSATSEQMAEMYSRCFCALRLTKHDGLSNSVIEAGLCGRKTYWAGWEDANGMGTPAKLGHGVEDNAMLAAVWINKQRIETRCTSHRPEHIAEYFRKFLDIGDVWKDTAYYDAPTLKLVPADQSEYKYRDYFEYRYSSGARGAGGPDPKSKEVEFTNQLIRDLLARYGCDSLIDYGCGSMVRWDSLPVADYHGVDVSEKALGFAREKFPEAKFSVRDLSVPPPRWSGRAYDAAISIDMMQHVKPEHFRQVMDNIFLYASKLVIIKTTPKMPDKYNEFYQFSHDWESTNPTNWYVVPGAEHSRIYVYEKSRTQGNGLADRNNGDADAGVHPARSPEGACHAGDACCKPGGSILAVSE